MVVRLTYRDPPRAPAGFPGRQWILFDPLGRWIEKRNELTGQSEAYTYRDDDVAADFEREGSGPFALTATYVQDLGIDAKYPFARTCYQAPKCPP